MLDAVQWKALVHSTISSHEPEFHAVYFRSRRRAVVRWVLAVAALGAVALTLTVFIRPAHRPTFRDQVSSFVDLVYRD